MSEMSMDMMSSDYEDDSFSPSSHEKHLHLKLLKAVDHVDRAMAFGNNSVYPCSEYGMWHFDTNGVPVNPFSDCEMWYEKGAVIPIRLPVCEQTEGDICFGCGDGISDRHLLRVSGRSWHVQCLRCCVCQTQLERQTTCFIKEDNIYCRVDYTREFGAKCAKCSRHIQPNDWVRRAREHVYHLACFSCDSCKRQLSTGEEFALHDSRVLCKSHYVEILEGGPCKDADTNQKAKTKRVRTTFTEEQVQVLQANFQLDSNPDGQDLERIAQITGLSKRVTQVWFQNSRARQKKYQQQQKGDNCNRSLSPREQLTIITDEHSPHWSSGEECGSSNGMSFME